VKKVIISKKHDLEILGTAHDKNREASQLLAKMEIPKTNLKVRHMRIKTRELMKNSRIKMRQMRAFIIKINEQK